MSVTKLSIYVTLIFTVTAQVIDQDTIKEIRISTKMYFNISTMDGEHIGQVLFGLFGYDVPFAVDGVLALATHRFGVGYRGTVVVVYRGDKIYFGGQYVNGTTLTDPTPRSDDPRARHEFSAFGANFYASLGALVMIEREDLYVTMDPDPHSKQLYQVLFGWVLRGLDVLEEIEHSRLDKYYRPLGGAVVVACGEIPLKNGEVIYVNKTHPQNLYTTTVVPGGARHVGAGIWVVFVVVMAMW